jgi:hypothetical protein
VIALVALLVLAAFIITLVHAARPSFVPLWVPLLLTTIALLVQLYPFR